MFKATSQNSQRRAVSRVVNDRSNDAIDATVFKDRTELDAEMMRLREEKKGLEAKIAAVNANITEADLRRYSPGRLVSPQLVSKWRQDRVGLISALAAHERKLTEYKKARQQERHAKEKRFEQAFLAIAKEILAEPVFQKLVDATLQRCGDDVIKPWMEE